MGIFESKSSDNSEQLLQTDPTLSDFLASEITDLTNSMECSSTDLSNLAVISQVVDELVKKVENLTTTHTRKKKKTRRKKKKAPNTVENLCKLIVIMANALQGNMDIYSIMNHGAYKKFISIMNKNTNLRKANRSLGPRQRMYMVLFKRILIPVDNDPTCTDFLPLPFYAIKNENFELLKAFVKLYQYQTPRDFKADAFIESSEISFGVKFDEAIHFYQYHSEHDYYHHNFWTYAHQCLNFDFLVQLDFYPFSESIFCLERLLVITLLMVENPKRTNEQLVFATKLLPFLTEKAKNLNGRISEMKIGCPLLLERIINLPSIEFASHQEQEGENKVQTLCRESKSDEDQTLNGDSFYGGFFELFSTVIRGSFVEKINPDVGFKYMKKIITLVNESSFSEECKRYKMKLLNFVFTLSPYRLENIANILSTYPEDLWIHREQSVKKILGKINIKRKVIRIHNKIHSKLGRSPHDMLHMSEDFSDDSIASLQELVYGMKTNLQEIVENLQNECCLILELLKAIPSYVQKEYFYRLRFEIDKRVDDILQDCLIGRNDGFHKKEYNFENDLDEIPNLKKNELLLYDLKKTRAALEMVQYYSKSQFDPDTECSVCYEKTPYLERYPFVNYRLENPDKKICSHLADFCLNCMTNFCKMVVRKPNEYCTGRGIKCTTQGCKSIISLEQFLSFYAYSWGREAPAEYRTKLRETIRELAIAEDPNSTFCSCGNVVSLSTRRPMQVTASAEGESKSCCFSCEETDAENKFQVKCLKCSNELCLKCGESHRTLSCAENMSKKNGAYLKSSKTRVCPNCSSLINRISGCDHVQCQVCKYKFCYNCMSVDYNQPTVYWKCGSKCSNPMKPFGLNKEE